MAEQKYEMINVIVNAGYSGLVMDAAKNAGARGGTIIHARGTANKQAEEFFHISIEPDKDLVILLVPANIKDAVLHEVYKNAGLDSEGSGIAFSIPVDKAVGLSKPQKQETKDAKEEKLEKEGK